MCLGIPGKIVEIVDARKHLALVDVSGVRRQVNISCLLGENADLSFESGFDHLLGSWVLVHVGFAMGIIDELEAEKTLELLRSLDEARSELESMEASKLSVMQD